MAKWTSDKTHSSVEFSVKHLGVSWVKGRFNDFNVNAEFEPANLEAGLVEAVIKASSIWTGNEGRDNHLRSADFFDAENHPDIVFKSSKIEKSGDDTYKIYGDLTMRGITKPAILEGRFLGAREIPSGEGKSETRAGISAKTTINRHDFGISWDAPAGEGATAAGAEVDVMLEMEFIKQ